jgi:hypothetical protein
MPGSSSERAQRGAAAAGAPPRVRPGARHVCVSSGRIPSARGERLEFAKQVRRLGWTAPAPRRSRPPYPGDQRRGVPRHHAAAGLDEHGRRRVVSSTRRPRGGRAPARGRASSAPRRGRRARRACGCAGRARHGSHEVMPSAWAGAVASRSRTTAPWSRRGPAAHGRRGCWPTPWARPRRPRRDAAQEPHGGRPRR